MRHVTRSHHKIAGLHPVPLLPDLDDELAFDGIKPFILIIMQMPRGATRLVKGIFQYEHAVGVRWKSP